MRTSGVLMHLTSLPSPYGIGTMGFAARAFVDFLAESGQTWWQILPIGPTSYGDSPYQSFSTFAGNAYLIDLDELAQEDLRPVEVAGCPPDSFAPDGQMWGNPLFDWDVMADTGYSWWIDRIAWQKECYDILRIDHFRGFDSYYAIPFGDATARNGHWRKGPGLEFFRAIEAALGPQKFIAEDLGFLTDSVHQLLLDTGYPGMKILQFGFDCREATTDLPHCYSHHCVAYVGTHDNDTALGWLTGAAPEDRAHVIDYLKLSDTEGYNWGLMRGIWSSKADLTVVQAQDLLGLGSEARMNTPSTLGCNWKWRALPGSFTSALSSRLRHETELYGRLTSKPSFTSQKL